MNKKKVLLTILITILLLGFISFLFYTIYCYAYYDKNQEKEYIKMYNDKKYDYVYEHLYNRDNITKEEYYNVINLMLNKNKLKEIYNKYYVTKYTINEFLDLFYYGDSNISYNNIEFNIIGKTSYNSRRKIEYKKIYLDNNSSKSVITVLEDVNFIVEDNSKIIIDSNECNIIDNICHYDYLLSGIHIIEYTSNNINYYALLNIVDNDNISITNLDSLININIIVKDKISE